MTFLEKRNSDLNFKERVKQIKAFGIDVDGVLTDGTLLLLGGKNYRFFNTQDGIGLLLLKTAGIKTLIITGKSSPELKKRVAELKIDYLYENAKNKLSAMKDFLKKEKLGWKETCYMGDDLPDLPLMEKVGLAITPSNGCKEVKKASHFVCQKTGGDGAVREAIEHVLKEQKKWEKTIRKFLQVREK